MKHVSPPPRRAAGCIHPPERHYSARPPSRDRAAPEGGPRRNPPAYPVLDKTDDYVSRELEDSVDDGPIDDNELDGPENEEDELSEPNEPSLGALERNVSGYGPDGYNHSGDQSEWGASGSKDLEDEHDGGEPGEDDEPTLGSVEGSGAWKSKNAGQEAWARGSSDDREGDPGCDDREGDELLHGGDEHDGAEPDEDGEPTLGWTEPREKGQQALGDNGTEPEQGSTSSVDLIEGRSRYSQRDRSSYTNRDGKHVDAEQGFASRKRLRNLSDRQKEIVAPRLDRDAVSLT
jgi:hypothetical protein